MLATRRESSHDTFVIVAVLIATYSGRLAAKQFYGFRLVAGGGFISKVSRVSSGVHSKNFARSLVVTRNFTRIATSAPRSINKRTIESRYR
jgi:hypothetical protein